MAHMVETMAYAGETPWHGLGVRVPSDLSPIQMLEKAELDWEVTRVPAYVEVNGKKHSVGMNALVRSTDNKVLDVVSADWNPVQNHEAFEFFHEYCAAGDMEMHTAGSLRGGQVVWALAKVKESFELFKGDQVDSYMLFTNPHQFGRSIDIRFTPIRVVCNNTLTLSLNTHSDRVVRKNHRTEFNPSDVKQQLGIATNHLQKYKEIAQFLGSKRYSKESITEYFKRVFPVIALDKEKGPQRKELSKSAVEAIATLETQPGAQYAEGSWWQGFNCVTYMTDHKIGRSQGTRMYSSWFGTNKTLKQKALDLAVEFAEMA